MTSGDKAESEGARERERERERKRNHRPRYLSWDERSNLCRNFRADHAPTQPSKLIYDTVAAALFTVVCRGLSCHSPPHPFPVDCA